MLHTCMVSATQVFRVHTSRMALAVTLNSCARRAAALKDLGPCCARYIEAASSLVSCRRLRRAAGGFPPGTDAPDENNEGAPSDEPPEPVPPEEEPFDGASEPLSEPPAALPSESQSGPGRSVELWAAIKALLYGEMLGDSLAGSGRPRAKVVLPPLLRLDPSLSCVVLSFLVVALEFKAENLECTGSISPSAQFSSPPLMVCARCHDPAEEFSDVYPISLAPLLHCMWGRLKKIRTWGTKRNGTFYARSYGTFYKITSP